MLIKRGVDRRGVHPLIWFKLALADRQHIVLAGEELVVTSIRRPFVPGARLSRHSTEELDELVTAVDLRRWRLDELGSKTNPIRMTERFCRWMQQELGIGVLLEPEWMTKEQIEARGGIENIVPHIHAQLRIDPSEMGFRETE